MAAPVVSELAARLEAEAALLYEIDFRSPGVKGSRAGSVGARRGRGGRAAHGGRAGRAGARPRAGRLAGPGAFGGPGPAGVRRSGESSVRTQTGPDGPATDTLRRTISKHTEVMVKVTGVKRDAAGVANSMTYLSREGELELETETGEKVAGRAEVRAYAKDWAEDAPRMAESDGTSREAFNLVLSMPAGTDGQKVYEAVREFADAEFGGERRYATVLHPDTDHVHVHLIVKGAGEDGARLNPRKHDLRRWRERFAETLRDRGIEANATSRAVRGVTLKSESAAVYQMQRDHDAGKVRRTPSRVVAEREAAERAMAIDGASPPPLHEAQRRAVRTRARVIARYENCRDILIEGGKPGGRIAAERIEKLIAGFQPVVLTRAATRLRSNAMRYAREVGMSTPNPDAAMEALTARLGAVEGRRQAEAARGAQIGAERQAPSSERGARSGEQDLEQ